MPSKKKAPHFEQDASYAVGDRVKVNLHTGRIVDATVKAVVRLECKLRVNPRLGDIGSRGINPSAR